MNHIKSLGLTALAAWVIFALAGASVASATTGEVKGVKQTGSITLKGSLEAGTSAVFTEELGGTLDTCTAATFEGKTSTFSGSSIGGALSTLLFGGCSHTTDVLSKGNFSISAIKGTTNGDLSSSAAEIQMRSTFFGVNAVCKTGAGTHLGTITGKASGQATVDINTNLDCGILGIVGWTASYVVTSPEGFGIVE